MSKQVNACNGLLKTGTTFGDGYGLLRPDCSEDMLPRRVRMPSGAVQAIVSTSMEERVVGLLKRAFAAQIGAFAAQIGAFVEVIVA